MGAKTMLDTIAQRLREVAVRPTRGAGERQRWDVLMGAHHYLPFRGLVGRSVRHVAVLGEHWLALIGWHAGAFKLKARDGWIGWLPEQQFRRLHLIANNARFVILPGCSVANLASRVLGLSVRRVSDDFRTAHGHPVLLAETFVDRSRFTGACYRAANWQVLGQTRGYARRPGVSATWVAHGQPKEVLVYPLVRNAREQLRALDDAPTWRSEGEVEPWTANRLRSLWECLRTVPEFRGTHGRRYPLATILAIAVAAKLAGYHGTRAFAQFADGLTQHQLRALRAFYSHRLGRFTAPTTTAFFNVLVALDPDVLDRAARTWAAQHARADEPVAIDGKCIRGAARQDPNGKHHLVAAVEHRSGNVLGQEAVAHKSNEIPTVRTLATGLDLQGRVVTVDAMHVQNETARCLVEQCGAHYVMTAVKSNQPNLLIDLQGLDWERPEVRATEHRRSNKGHGRFETRSCRVLDLTEHRDKAPLPHRTVAFRIERERRNAKTAKTEHETVHGLTSVPPEQATAELVLALVRGHWSIENRLHHVRDVSYGEDRCRVRTGHLPRNLACLTNLAISIVRIQRRFDFLPQANRHYARRPQDAVRQLLEPPKR